MKSVTTSRFRKAYSLLPAEVKATARNSYKKWQINPKHSSLQFKQIHKSQPIYSVRVGISWRALGIKEDDVMIWFWIGSHSEYDKLIASI